MGVTTSGIRWPEPADPINQGALAMRNLAEDVTVRGARLLGSATMTAGTLPAGGGTVGTSGALSVAAVPYPRIVQVTLVQTLSSATTWCAFTLRQAGADILSFRAVTPQQTTRTVWTELVPANTARSYAAVITSSAAAAVYATAGVAELSAVAFLAA